VFGSRTVVYQRFSVVDYQLESIGRHWRDAFPIRQVSSDCSTVDLVQESFWSWREICSICTL